MADLKNNKNLNLNVIYAVQILHNKIRSESHMSHFCLQSEHSASNQTISSQSDRCKKIFCMETSLNTIILSTCE